MHFNTLAWPIIITGRLVLAISIMIGSILLIKSMYDSPPGYL